MKILTLLSAPQVANVSLKDSSRSSVSLLDGRHDTFLTASKWQLSLEMACSKEGLVLNFKSEVVAGMGMAQTSMRPLSVPMLSIPYSTLSSPIRILSANPTAVIGPFPAVGDGSNLRRPNKKMMLRTIPAQEKAPSRN